MAFNDTFYFGTIDLSKHYRSEVKLDNGLCEHKVVFWASPACAFDNDFMIDETVSFGANPTGAANTKISRFDQGIQQQQQQQIHIVILERKEKNFAFGKCEIIVLV